MEPFFIYAGLLGLIGIVLAVQVTMLRNKKKILHGDGGDMELMLAIRRFGNYAEYAPMGLVLLALTAFVDPFSTGDEWFVDVVGLALVVGRILHPFGIKQGTGVPILRVIGQALTWLAIAACSIYLIVGAFD